MKKIALTILLIAAAGTLAYIYYSEIRKDPVYTSALISINSPEYQQVSQEAICEPAPNTDFTIPTLTISEIQAMKANTVLLDSMLDPDTITTLFYSSEITTAIKERIWNISYPEDASVALGELRYLRVLHRGFDGATHIGELIVNKSISEDVLEIFYELYLQDYPIEKMILVDEYGGDDVASMNDNNTSAFNYRKVTNSKNLSNHSFGMAIDINPLYNPYVMEVSSDIIVSPESGAAYVDRSQDFPYKMDANDPCVQLFKAHGFAWGGDWASPKDYQHFEQYVAP